MTVYWKAYGAVSLRLKDSGSLALPEGSDLNGLKAGLGLPRHYPVCFTVNGTVAPPATVLRDGDRVEIMNLASAG